MVSLISGKLKGSSSTPLKGAKQDFGLAKVVVGASFMYPLTTACKPQSSMYAKSLIKNFLLCRKNEFDRAEREREKKKKKNGGLTLACERVANSFLRILEAGFGYILEREFKRSALEALPFTLINIDFLFD